MTFMDLYGICELYKNAIFLIDGPRINMIDKNAKYYFEISSKANKIWIYRDDPLRFFSHLQFDTQFPGKVILYDISYDDVHSQKQIAKLLMIASVTEITRYYSALHGKTSLDVIIAFTSAHKQRVKNMAKAYLKEHFIGPSVTRERD